MFCDRCGTRLSDPANFCPACGKAAGITPLMPVNCRIAGPFGWWAFCGWPYRRFT
jgi:predicted amidophosphoribosyltransferase